MSGNIFLLALVLWPFVGSLAVFAFGSKKSKKVIDAWALASGFVELLIIAVCLLIANKNGLNNLYVPYVEGFGLNFKLDGFRIVYTAVTIIMWVCSLMISGEYFAQPKNLVRYYVFCLWTFAATVGVFISADLMTTFTFFEIMSLASYAFVAQTEKKDAMRAAETYLAVAIIGGLVMLMGLMMLYHEFGTLEIAALHELSEKLFAANDISAIRRLYTAGGLILFGFGAKAGMFPMHIWLPKAHPVAPAPASALLSGVLTKSGIFGVLILCLEIFAEDDKFGYVIVILGVITMFVGAVLAVFSTDLKRTLACSSVSQIGFILIGIGLVPMLGEESTLAMSGAMLYMVNHSAFKLALFLSAAAIYMNCHMLNLNDIRGFGRDLPVLKVLFAIGALGISGVPGLSGYVSKTLIHEGIVEYIHMNEQMAGTFKAIEILFLFSGGMTFSYMLKLFFAIFVDKPRKDCKYSDHKKSIGLLSYISIAVPAAAILFFGLFSKVFITKLAVFMGNFNTRFYNEEQLEILENLRLFSWENLKGSLISLSIGAVLFVLIRLLLTENDKLHDPEYVNRWPKFLDLEELVYRPLLCVVFPFLFRTVGAFVANLVDGIFVFLKKYVFRDTRATEHTTLRKLQERYDIAESNYKIVSSGISYGMLLICIGLCFTLFYLLYLLFS